MSEGRVLIDLILCIEMGERGRSCDRRASTASTIDENNGDDEREWSGK
jgi:hypothetical protein